MAVESWPEYVRRIAGTLTQAQISGRTDGRVSASSVGRWLRGEPGLPEADSVIAFATAFGRSPIEALTIAGYLEKESEGAARRWALADYTTAEILAELGRRSAEFGS